MAIYSSFVLSFLFIMIPISSQLSDVFDNSLGKEEYEKILRYYVWGGRESYTQRRELKNSIQDASGAKRAELELPGWGKFVEISRSLLDAPSEIKSALIPCRELSLRYVSDIERIKDLQLKSSLRGSNRTLQFLLAASDYLHSATGLPKDFHSNLKETIGVIDSAN
ncbi:hypothetical protein D3C78_1362540 [compost metagenome]